MDKKQCDYLGALISLVTPKAEEETVKITDNCDDLNHLFHLDQHYIESFGCTEQTAGFIRLVAALNSRKITDKFKFGKKYLQKDIEDYICGLFFGSTVETIYMLMFDKDNIFLACDSLGDGTVNASGFLPRKMLDVALRKNAYAVILAHNHPMGKTVPSTSDLVTTSLSKTVLSDAGIKFVAHYIVSGTEIADFLPKTMEKYEEPKMIFKVSANPN